MADSLPLLELKSRSAWRKWLQSNHATSSGVWLVYHKQHTGEAAIDYEDSMREALCFGWIDSLIKRIDENRYARKFTPRKPTSKWSDINRKRWKELEKAGLLAPAGRAAAPTDNRYAPKPDTASLAAVPQEFKGNAKAWRFFQQLAPTYQRDFLAWINTARRPETRHKRIAESVRLLARGEKLGLK